MITAGEVKAACNSLVQATFPDIKIYGNDTVDGYVRPSFFSEILHHGYSYDTKNYARNGATYKLTLFERSHDEAYCLDLFEQLRAAFGMTFRVGGRHLLVGDISYEFIGENADMLQVSVEFDWTEHIPKRITEDMMETINLTMYERGD